MAGGFRDQRHLDTYEDVGAFPRIHDELAALVRAHAPEAEPVLDLGSCTGLLAVRLVAEGRSSAVGVEGNAEDVRRAIQHPRVTYRTYHVTAETLPALELDLRDSGASLVSARRVFPEMAERGGVELVRAIAELLAQVGVKRLAVQGRVPTRRAVSPLWCLDRELAQLCGPYEVLARGRQSAMLTLR